MVLAIKSVLVFLFFYPFCPLLSKERYVKLFGYSSVFLTLILFVEGGKRRREHRKLPFLSEALHDTLA